MPKIRRKASHALAGAQRGRLRGKSWGRLGLVVGRWRGVERRTESGQLVAGQARAGMGGRVHLGELAHHHAGVDLGGGEAGVAQQLLDEADVGPALQHQGRGRVAEEMAGPGLAQARRAHITAWVWPSDGR